MKHKILNSIIILVLVLSISPAVFAQEIQPNDRMTGRSLPAKVEALKLSTPVETTGITVGVLDASLFGAKGTQRVIVRLSADSGAAAFEKGLDTFNAKKAAKSQQDAFIKRASSYAPGEKTVAQVQSVLNAVFMDVDAAALAKLAQDPDVVRIAPVGNYQIDLSETVPYIGATAVHTEGYTGNGIKVAVLDSGIDYTHAALGGSGNPADFANNDPTIIEPGTFPTAKVVGGYDFVGSDWSGEEGGPPEAPDPDPLDKGDGAGHGTHVAHIIGGVGGVAPQVKLYAVKVCSSVSTACSGVGLIQGMEFAVDPNNDGRFRDRVDLINMSLGSDYGQPFDDDLSAAVENLTKLGILTVSSAGNASDKPYAVGTPSATSSALSVAETNVPSAFLPLMQVTAPAEIVGEYPAVFQPWSAVLAGVIQAPLVYGNGANKEGCDPFPAGSLAGKIVLVDRGDCNFTLKIKNIGAGGGLIGIIGMVAPGDPFEGGDGGDRPITIPGYMVNQEISDILKSGLPDTVIKFDPGVGLPLVGVMVGGSSRGPQNESTTLIKPEIGAPGASVSAIYGTGTEEGPFGGTSGASPMVTGSAALLLQAYYTGFRGTTSSYKLSPVETKALLMNNAETNILNDALTGMLAPITRIGGGEVRVDRALHAPVVAWDNNVPTGALGFGFIDVADGVVSVTKTIRIRNLDGLRHVYNLSSAFRYADDELSGAVSISAPSQVVVKAGKGRDTLVKVTMTINGANLPDNYMNSGGMGADPSGLNINEYDGYLTLDDGSHPVHLAWHVLPRKAAREIPRMKTVIEGSFPQVIGLNNTGVGTAQNDAYALIATSPNKPQGGLGQQAPKPDLRAVGINTFPVPAGFCSAEESFIWAFAVNTWERQQHLLPVSIQWWLDTNQDGTADYLVLNRDASGITTISDGRQLTWVVNLETNEADAWFYAEHSMNTGNTALYICAEQVGLTGDDMLATNVDVEVVAQDFYYGGPSDAVTGLTVTPLGERFYGAPSDVPGNTNDPEGLYLFDYGLFPGNTPELGLMLFTNGARGDTNGGATQATEVLLFTLP
jgi:minor extracellular serine protease Vpr